MYIRTKNRIYKVFESPLNDDEDFVYVAPNGCISETDIINQSENLEELCDCIIVLDNKADLSLPLVFNCYGSKAFYEHIMKRYKKEKGFIFYLGIWTNKGLIYVAKMNESGDLELI